MARVYLGQGQAWPAHDVVLGFMQWLGEGVRYIRALFSLAAKHSPAVIFVDEVRLSLAGAGHGKNPEVAKSVKSVALTL